MLWPPPGPSSRKLSIPHLPEKSLNYAALPRSRQQLTVPLHTTQDDYFFWENYFFVACSLILSSIPTRHASVHNHHTFPPPLKLEGKDLSRWTGLFLPSRRLIRIVYFHHSLIRRVSGHRNAESLSFTPKIEALGTSIFVCCMNWRITHWCARAFPVRYPIGHEGVWT